MSYELAMTPINGLRISSDSKGINAIHDDEIVSITWSQVFDAINLYKPEMLQYPSDYLMIQRLEEMGYTVID